MLDGGVLDKVKDQPASELTDEKLICCQSRVRTGTPATPNDDDDDDDDTNDDDNDDDDGDDDDDDDNDQNGANKKQVVSNCHQQAVNCCQNQSNRASWHLLLSCEIIFGDDHNDDDLR